MDTAKYDKYYKELDRIITGISPFPVFKDKLEEALADGFPIDYLPSEDDSGYTLLNLALINLGDNEVEYVKLILDKGADIHITTSWGEANVFVIIGDIEPPLKILDLFFKHKDFDINARGGKFNHTPLAYAGLGYINEIFTNEQEDKLKVFIHLLEAGADPDIDRTWDIQGLKKESQIARRDNLLKIVAMHKEAIAAMKKSTNIDDYEYAI